MVRIRRVVSLLTICSMIVMAEAETASEHDVKFIFNTGIISQNYEMKVDDNIFESNSEGANLYNLNFKLNVYDSDILEFSKYGSLSESDTQDKLLIHYQENQKKSFYDGYYLTVQLFSLYSYLMGNNDNTEFDFIFDYEKQTYINGITTNTNIVYGVSEYNLGSNFQVKSDIETYRIGSYARLSDFDISTYFYKESLNRPTYTGFHSATYNYIDNAQIDTYGFYQKIKWHYLLDKAKLHAMLGWNYGFKSNIKFYDKKKFDFDAEEVGFNLDLGGDYRLFKTQYLDAFLNVNAYYETKMYSFENTLNNGTYDFIDDFYGGELNLKFVF